MKKRLLSLLLALTLVFPTALLFSCGDNGDGGEGGVTPNHARMTVDINPSVEFMIGEDGKVASVTALNDDGSVLIAGEVFVGKTPEEATELMITLATETGYLVKGNATKDENTVKISVSGEAEYAEELLTKVEEKTEKTLTALDINGKVEKLQAMGIEALRTLAMDTALFTEEEVAAMNEQQLCAAIAAGRIETAGLLTAEMREAYYSAKESRISFAQSEATVAIINEMGSLYQLMITGYSTALNSYSEAIDALDSFRYESLVSPESDYQKTLVKLREAKADLLEKKNFVATLEVNGEAYASATLELQLSEENYDKALAAYESLGTTLNTSLESLIAALRQNEEMLRSFEDSFSDDIKAELTAKAGELEAAVNAAKDSFFEEFEAAHKDDIAALEQSLIAQKNKLREQALGEDAAE